MGTFDDFMIDKAAKDGQEIDRLRDQLRKANQRGMAATARIMQLESLLRRVIEWEPGLPVEASLADEIGAALEHL